MAVYTPPPIDHIRAKNALRDRLTLLKASPHPEARGEEITNVMSVISTYERLYPEPRFNLIDCTPR